jgi:8-oxo-dGTP diphosphatase
MSGSVVDRPTARVLVLDADRVLLLHHRRRATGAAFWAPPGGRVDVGETFESAASREGEEETGLALTIGPCIATRHVEYVERAGTRHRMDTRYFLAKVDGDGQPRPHDGEVHAAIEETRWWTVAELRAVDGLRELGDLVARLLSDGVPETPFDLGVAEIHE